MLLARGSALFRAGIRTSELKILSCWSQAPTTSRCIHTTTLIRADQKPDTNNKWKWFRMTMSDEQKAAKTAKIEQMKAEEAPKSLFAKVKYYFKRYWYIAVPAHAASCTAWFIALYLMVKSGVDVIGMLEWMHMPEAIVEKVKNTPKEAGVIVVALILYKIAMPFRYMTTLLLIQGTFWTLRKMGKLQTAREVEFKVRTEYERNKSLYGRRWYRYRHLGVRSVSRKNSVHATTAQMGQVERLHREHEKLNQKQNLTTTTTKNNKKD